MCIVAMVVMTMVVAAAFAWCVRTTINAIRLMLHIACVDSFMHCIIIFMDGENTRKTRTS